jgi:hypothetical protein
VLSIPADKRETAFEGGCGDQTIKGPQTVRPRIGLEEFVAESTNAIVHMHEWIQGDKTVDAGNIAFVPAPTISSWAVMIEIRTSCSEST